MRHERITEPTSSYVARTKALEVFSRSELAAARIGPRTWYEKVHGEEGPESDAAAFGTLGHLLVLEPDEFKNVYHVLQRPEEIAPTLAQPTRGKAWAQYLERVAQENPTKRTVAPATLERAGDAAQAVWEHPVARDLLARCTVREETIRYWRTHPRGDMIPSPPELEIVVRPDAYGQDENGVPTCVDLKFSDVSPERFAGHAHRWGWDMAPPVYLPAVEAALGGTVHPAPSRFVWVVVSPKPPHHVRIFEASAPMLARGREDLALCIDRVLEWRQDPGRAATLHDEEGVTLVDPIGHTTDGPNPYAGRFGSSKSA